MPGAEPFGHQGGADGVLVLHGFTGNPHSMRPLAQALATAGFTVDLPLLPGHGTSIEDMVPTRWPDYLDAAESAFSGMARRCERVTLVGLSMGGTLACALAETHPEVRGIVLVNPIVDPPDQSLRDALRDLLESGSERVPGIGSDIAKEGATEVSYSETPVAAALSLFEGVDEVAPELAKISCPVLLFSSREDHVVPTSSGDLLLRSVSGPIERVWLERSYHVATLDNDAPEIEERGVAFMRKVLS
jgi:carboxylesterase